MSELLSRLSEALEGRYAIEREIGAGGMATVYLAQDLKHSRNVALKVLKPELAALVGAERFLAENKTTANLTHPHILPLHDSGDAVATRRGSALLGGECYTQRVNTDCSVFARTSRSPPQRRS